MNDYAPVTMKVSCEGDMEHTIKYIVARAKAKTYTELTVSVPNIQWPDMFMDLAALSMGQLEETDGEYVRVVFDLREQPDLDDLELDDLDGLVDKLSDMDDDQLQDWINDILEDLEDVDDEDED